MPNNGWTKKNLLIHLWVWDREFIQNINNALNGKSIVWSENFRDEEKLNKWNDEQIAKHKDKNFEEIMLMFEETREELFELYRALLKKEITEDEKTLFTLW